MYVIGFANTYFTLWTVKTETIYFTDSNGKAWPHYERTHFSYVKNIAQRLEVVQEKHPGVQIDETLRGKQYDFYTDNSKQDLSPDILKGGKYAGRSLNDIVKENLQYVIYCIDNDYMSYTAKQYALTLAEVKEHYQVKAEQEAAKVAGYELLSDGKHLVTFSSNPNRLFSEVYYSDNPDYQGEDIAPYLSHYIAACDIEKDNTLVILFPKSDIKLVVSKYPHNMAMINGKFRRLRCVDLEIDIKIIGVQKSKIRCVQFAVINK